MSLRSVWLAELKLTGLQKKLHAMIQPMTYFDDMYGTKTAVA